jgi:TonB family protein
MNHKDFATSAFTYRKTHRLHHFSQCHPFLTLADESKPRTPMNAALTRIYALLIAIVALAGCATPPITPQPVETQLPPAKPDVYDISKVDIQPIVTYNTIPEYPVELKRQGITGECVISFTVKQDGSVGDLMVVKANDIRFGTAGLNAISKWKFSPARLGGQPVDCRMQIPFKFLMPGN